ncbi:MAG TPA: hypothetical protein PKL92_10635, partial [Aquaticitalea sp.]|nr:hypothetical protein [Aquaticitalea sp.]
MKHIVTLLLLLSVCTLSAQKVYKTPSGKKYHTSTCKFVKNVSTELDISEAEKIHLTPCSQCGPKTKSAKSISNPKNTLGIKPNEAKGAKSTATQCT